MFIRTTGCNLRCWFCDTPYTSWSPEGVLQTWESVRDRVLETDVEHVVLTGGEPLLQPEVVDLTGVLRAAGRFVTVETAGTVYRPVAADLMSISPKLGNSTPGPEAGLWRSRHDANRERDAVVRRLLHESPYQLKFVVDRPADFDEIEAWLARFPEISADAVWLMPQSRTPEEYESRLAWIRPEAERRGWRVSRRMHIELFGNVRGR